ncbi:MAG: hypothetical protein JWO08_572 [Verrucomicrobiaceae bacterium]|nr:hypothetical protein [Verrucomicrobiaceae bacterium]
MPLPEEARAAFATIYATDLVFEPDCWKLCGDAHCCSFTRHKAKFRLMAKDQSQELPLLPGEWEFLCENGWDKQFGEHEFRADVHEVAGRKLRIESVVSKRPMCVCDHGTRTTVCRLYPLVPQYEINGHLAGTEPLGIYEELERLDGLDPACKITGLGYPQLNLFLVLTNTLASHPVLLFYLMAYRITKRHAAEAVMAKKTAAPEQSAFRHFETAYLRRQLINQEALDKELAELLTAFSTHYGQRFEDAWAVMHP